MAAEAEPLFEKRDVFVSGSENTHTFRIPALLKTKSGAILALCEARRASGADHGDVDLVLRRSHDGGRSWSDMQVLANNGSHTMGNPAPVLDQRSGTIWLPFSEDNKRVLLISSADDGKTWSKPRDITRDVLPANWHWVGPGPGHGIQLMVGPRAGRLVVPCWAGVERDVPFGATQLSYVLYSDDGGQNWRHGRAATINHSDECQVVELNDGRLYMNARSRMGKRRRAFSFSGDGGQTWSPIRNDPGMPERSCQGSTLRLGPGLIGVAHPVDEQARRELTVRASRDEGRTWPVSRVVDAGAAAYSDMAVNRRGEVLVAYESRQYQAITVARFSLSWLNAGKNP
jgi:sialidase-1